MMRFTAIGTSNSLTSLVSLLRARGAHESPEKPALVIVAASSVARAEELIAPLPLALRRRTVVVGLDAGLDYVPTKGSLGELLERFQLLGALPGEQATAATMTRFLGPKKDHLCELVGAGYFKGFSSPNYAVWNRLADVDAGAFLLSLVSSLDAEGTWFREGPDFPLQAMDGSAEHEIRQKNRHEFEVVGSRQLVAPLIDQLIALGAHEASSTSSLILIGVDTQPDAERLLAELTLEQRRRSVLVGISDSLEMEFLPRPESFAAMLDRSDVLGAMPASLAVAWADFGFCGRKDLADPLGIAWLKQFQSKRYAGWVGLTEFQNAGDLLLRLTALRAEGR